MSRKHNEIGKYEEHPTCLPLQCKNWKPPSKGEWDFIMPFRSKRRVWCDGEIRTYPLSFRIKSRWYRCNICSTSGGITLIASQLSGTPTTVLWFVFYSSKFSPGLNGEAEPVAVKYLLWNAEHVRWDNVPASLTQIQKHGYSNWTWRSEMTSGIFPNPRLWVDWMLQENH